MLKLRAVNVYLADGECKSCYVNAKSESEALEKLQEILKKDKTVVALGIPRKEHHYGGLNIQLRETVPK